MKSRAEMKKQYKESPAPIGVFLVRNKKTNEFVLGTSLNLNGALNLHRQVLKWGKPTDLLIKNPKILEDYRNLGDENFEFAVLDTLKPKDEPGWDPKEDLKALEKIWSDELKFYSDQPANPSSKI
jgi:hypothetical protein